MVKDFLSSDSQVLVWSVPVEDCSSWDIDGECTGKNLSTISSHEIGGNNLFSLFFDPTVDTPYGFLIGH